MAASWILKLDRAEKHLKDFRSEVSRYTNGHHYEAIPVVGGPKCNEHQVCFSYRLRITQQPDETLQPLAGDILYNVRSALDHLAVALVPSARRSNASFPIELENIWDRDSRRRYIVRDPERRRRFNTAIAGMKPGAVTVIKELQPYNLGLSASDSGLHILSRLCNLDKHRKLIPAMAGVAHLITDVVIRGHGSRIPARSPHGPPFTEDRAQVIHLVVDPVRLPNVVQGEVNVRLTGTPLIAIKIRQPAGGVNEAGWMDVENLFRTVIENVRKEVIPALEPFLRAK